VNRGIQSAQSHWIAVLNSDVELAPELPGATGGFRGGWFATGRCLSAQDPAPHRRHLDLVSRGGAAWRAGSDAWTSRHFHARTYLDGPWTAALFRATLFERVGLLDELFESYLETWISECAAQTLAGGEYVPPRRWHQGSATLGAGIRRLYGGMSRNQVFLLARHYPRHLLWKWAWPILVGQLLWGGVALRHVRYAGVAERKMAGPCADLPPSAALRPLAAWTFWNRFW